MSALTPRERVCELVESSAKFTKIPIWALWQKLYAEFQKLDNHAVYRLAHNTGRTELDTVEEEGWMHELLVRAEKFLKQDPALQDNKKAPLQGSLLDTEDAQ